MRFPKDRENKIVYPKVIQRACLKSDFFPFDKQPISVLLRLLPKEYIYGLKQVELRPRPNSGIGNPLGLYRRSEKKIILYSAPKNSWDFDKLGQGAQDYYELHGATVLKESNSSVKVVWKEVIDLAFLFYTVFLHELGHHYQHQYRTKESIPDLKVSREKFAELVSSKLRRINLFNVWRTSKHFQKASNS